MGRTVWILSIVVVAVVTGLGWLADRPNYRELTLREATILGHLKGVVSPRAEYFSVRIPSGDGSQAGTTTAYLLLAGRRFDLARVSPVELQQAGFEESPGHNSGQRFLSVGYGDQNRDGSVEFTLQGPVLKAFYARCHRPHSCEFSIGWEGLEPFGLPIDERILRPRIPQPTKTKDFAGH